MVFHPQFKSKSPLYINGEVVERVDSFTFLGTTISSSLKWEDNITNITKKAHQRLFFLRQLRKFGVACGGMLQFYRAAIERVLTFTVPVCYGNSTVQQRLQLDRIVNMASKISGCKLFPICEIYEARIHRKGLKILQDVSSHCFFNIVFMPFILTLFIYLLQSVDLRYAFLCNVSL